MIKVFQTITEVEASIVKSVFLENGIEATIKNQNITNIAGEVPFTESYTEIWVDDGIDYEEIKNILARYQNVKEATFEQATWCCPSCNEENDNNFEVCWQCQTPSSSK